jgi:hypothetical protein
MHFGGKLTNTTAMRRLFFPHVFHPMKMWSVPHGRWSMRKTSGRLPTVSIPPQQSSHEAANSPSNSFEAAFHRFCANKPELLQ